MKKIFAFALAMVSTVSMFAAINSQLTIYLDTDSKEVEARVACGDTYSPFNAASSATYVPMYSNPSNIGLYVHYQGGDYMELNAPQLVNVPVVIVTSREAAALQNYELFAELGAAANNSEPVYMTDLRPDNGGAPVTFELNNTTDYSFTLKNEADFVEGTNSVIADRFVINYNPAALVISLTTNDYGWASFSYDANVQPALPAGLKIYTGEYNGADALNLTQVDYVKANEGVVVYGMPNTTYYFAAGTGSSVYGTNNLKPTSAFDPNNYSNVFVLKGDALLEYVGSNALAANKAYLQLPTSAPAPRRINFVFSATEGVENVGQEPVANCQKLMIDGQVFIRRGDAVYNLQGQMVK